MPGQTRAPNACHRCRQRRIKCDVSVTGTPCSRCRQRGFDDCHLIPCRRGIYVRKGRKSRPEQASGTFEQTPDEEGPLSLTPQQTETPGEDGHVTSQCDSPATDGVGHNEEVPHTDTRGQKTWSSRGGHNGTVSQGQTAGHAAQTAEETLEISWPAVFEHFLQSPTAGKEVLDKAYVTYMGDSFPISLILNDHGEDGKLRVHHSWPKPRPDPSGPNKHPRHMRGEDLAYLEAKGAFRAPKKTLANALVQCFLDTVYPFYPIVNRDEFTQLYTSGNLPWMLLHAVCFMGATYCPLPVLHSAGFSSRKQARTTFYDRTKCLFDLGYEKDKIVVLQSLILLTFWVGKPTDFWTSFTWVGNGVIVAETLGLHRSTALTSMTAKDKSLWKRLWWVLFVRDAFAAALFGRTMKIDTSQSDVEMLTEGDFGHDTDITNEIDIEANRACAAYQIRISELAILLRDAIRYRCHSAQDEMMRMRLHRSLEQWRRSIPSFLDWHVHPPGSNPFSSALSIVYENQLIFIHLTKAESTLEMDSTFASQGSAWSSGSQPSVSTPVAITRAAAQRLTAATTALVTKDLLTSMPHEVFTGIFSAGAALYKQMRCQDPVMAQLACSQLTLCQMAMHEAREFWDSAPWVMQLFSNLISRGTRDQVPPTLSHDTWLSSLETLGIRAGADNLSAARVEGNQSEFSSASNTLYDSWPGHPMLSSFLDICNDPNTFYDITDLSPTMSNPPLV